MTLDGLRELLLEGECPCCLTHSCARFRRWSQGLIDLIDVLQDYEEDV